MKQTKNKATKHSSTKAKSAHKAVDSHVHTKTEDLKDWSSSFSRRFLSNYAIPFTRLVEAKLVSLQNRV